MTLLITATIVLFIVALLGSLTGLFILFRNLAEEDAYGAPSLSGDQDLA